MIYEFNILIEGTSTGATISCGYDVFSANKSIICDYIAECGGILDNSNTAIVHSIEEVEKLSHKLLKLTIPVHLSKKRK